MAAVDSKRLTANQAKHIFDYWSIRFTGKRHNTHKPKTTISARPRGSAWQNRATWDAPIKKTHEEITNKDIGCLCACVEISGTSMPVRGIALEYGLVRQDKQRIKILLAHTLIAMKPDEERAEHFIITEDGLRRLMCCDTRRAES